MSARDVAIPGRKTPAVGRKKSGSLGRETGIIFDEDMFEATRKCAIRENTSFAEQVRTFCQWGLDAGTDEPGVARQLDGLINTLEQIAGSLHHAGLTALGDEIDNELRKLRQLRRE